MSDNEQHNKDFFNPAILKSFDFGNILKDLLDSTKEISDKIASYEKDRLRDEYKLDTVLKEIEKIKVNLEKVNDPKTGLIAIVEAHAKKLEELEAKNIIEKVQNSDKVINNLTRLGWLVVSAIIGLAVKVIFFP